jgi:hypothetical protein
MSDKENSLARLPDKELDEQQKLRHLAFEADQERKRQQFEAKLEAQKAKRDWMMLIITFAAVAAAYWTGWEARHARIEATQAAKETVTIQQRSVNAQIEAMRLDARPYVSASIKSWRRLGTAPERLGITILITSSGRTAALNVRLDVGCSQMALFVLPESRDPTAFIPQATPILAPSSATQKGRVCPFTSDSPLKIYGRVTYADLFKQPHSTSFCFEIGNPYGKYETAYPCSEFKVDIT